VTAGRRAIVCIGGFWEGFSSRRQHFMSRFAGSGVQVLFVEPSESWSAAFSGSRKSPLLLPRLRTVLPGLSVLTPTIALPLRHSLLVSLVDHCAWSLQIRGALRRRGLTPELMWIYDPRYADAVRFLRPKRLLFDMVDDYMPDAYGGWRVRRGTRWLLANSDICVFTSPVLAGRYGSSARAHLVIPNGYDPGKFNMDATKPPDDWPSVEGPVLGFVGTLFRHIDFELLSRAAAMARSRGGVLLAIGLTEPSGREGASKVAEAGGVLLGPRPHSELIRYVQRFSLCLAPFVRNEVAASVSPLKVYEYMACGRPVFATGLRSLDSDPIGPFVYRGEEMTLDSALDASLALGPDDFRKLASAASPATWDRRFESLTEGLDRLGASPAGWPS